MFELYHSIPTQQLANSIMFVLKVTTISLQNTSPLSKFPPTLPPFFLHRHFSWYKHPMVSNFWNITTVIAAEYIMDLGIVYWLSEKSVLAIVIPWGICAPKDTSLVISVPPNRQATVGNLTNFLIIGMQSVCWHKFPYTTPYFVSKLLRNICLSTHSTHGNGHGCLSWNIANTDLLHSYMGKVRGCFVYVQFIFHFVLLAVSKLQVVQNDSLPDLHAVVSLQLFHTQCDTQKGLSLSSIVLYYS